MQSFDTQVGLLAAFREPRDQLQADDLERASGGTEILSWDLTNQEWAAHIARRIEVHESRLVAARRVAGVAGLAAMFAASVGVGALRLWHAFQDSDIPPLAWIPLLGTASMVVVLLGAVFVWLKSRAAIGELEEERQLPVRVRLTSTGVIAGGVARVWRGDRFRISRCRLAPGQPAALHLDFERTDWLRWLSPARNLGIGIPIPAPLEEAVAESVGVLWARIGSRAAPAEESPLAYPTRE